MDLISWTLEFKPGWDIHFQDFDKSIQIMILNKFEKMKQPLFARGLKSSRYLIEEVGQYRIAFIQDDATKIKFIYFVGNHKQYENWYTRQ